MSEEMAAKVSELPSFDPQGTEAITSIPERFLVGGILGLRSSGVWTFRGEVIEHQGICLFLARQLRRTEEGHYWVVNGPQRVLVEIEETPYFISLLDVDVDAGVMRVRLNDQSEEQLELETLFRGPDEVLYAEVKRGAAGAVPGAAHLARFLRTAVMPLEPYLIPWEDDEDGVGLDFVGHRQMIPRQPLPPITGR